MGYLFACLAVLMWSFNSIISTEFAAKLTPVELAFGRWFIAAVVLAPFVIRGLKGKWNIVRAHLKLIVLMSILGMVLTNTILYYAGHTTSAVDISLMNRTGPIFIVILSAVFLKVPVSGRQIFGILLSVAGVVYIILNGTFDNLTNLSFLRGDLWMLASAFSFAVYSILQYRRPPELGQVAWLWLLATSAAVILAPGFIYQEVTDSHLKSITLEDVGVILYLGIGLSVVAYLSWNEALNRIGMIKASVITYLSPVSTAIITATFLGAHLVSAQFVGGLMALCGVLIVSLSKTHKSPLVEKNSASGAE